MPESAGTPIDVDARTIDFEIVHRRHGHGSKRLVDLIQVGILGLPAELGQSLPDSAHGCGREPLRLMCMACIGKDPGDRLQTTLASRACAHQHQSRRTIGNGRGAGRGDGAILAEGRLERGNLVQIAGARRLVAADHDFALAALDGDRRHFCVELACLQRAQGAPNRLRRELILRGARELVAARGGVREATHQLAVERTLQAVVEHVIEDFAVTHAIAATGLQEQVRRVRHRLHAAGENDVRTAGADLIGAHHHGLHPGAAHFVDGRGRSSYGDPGAQRGLARRRLAQAGGQYAAHDHFLDVAGLQPCRLDGGLGRSSAELRRRQRGEHSLEGADGRAPGGNDDHIFAGHA